MLHVDIVYIVYRWKQYAANITTFQGWDKQNIFGRTVNPVVIHWGHKKIISKIICFFIRTPFVRYNVVVLA